MPSACNPTRWFGNTFSQTAQVRERKAKGLHPVNEMQRFYMLVCCFFCSTTVSITYAFDMFTKDLQTKFGLSAGDLTTVSTVGLVFCYFLVPYSLLYEACGPFLLFCICFVLGGAGALLMAFAFADKVKGNLATFSVYYAMLSICSGVIDVAYITTLAEMFPRNRGPVIALVKVMTSLGSSALACICVNIFKSDIISYIYFLMALAMVVSAWAAFTVKLPPYYMNWWRRRGKTEEEIAELEATKPYYERKFVPKPRLIIGYVIIAALLVFFTVQSPVIAYSKNVTNGGRTAVGVVCIVLVLCIFILCMPFRFLGGVDEPAPSKRYLASTPVEQTNKDGEVTMDSGEGAYLSDDAAMADNGDEAAAEAEEPNRQDPRFQGTLKDYLLGLDLWLLLLMTFLGGALGTIVAYNSSTVSIAINGYPRSTELSALYTAFMGVGSAVGRIAMGLFEAYVQHQEPGKRRVIITLGFFVPPVVTTIAGILLLTIPGKAILLPFILIYFQNGWSAAVNALMFPALFENRHNILYSLNFFGTVIKLITINRLLFGLYTDKQQKALGFSHGESCTKPECVRMPLIVTTCMGFVSIFIVLLIHIRYTRFLARAHAKAEAEAEAEAAAEEMGDVTPIDSGIPQKAMVQEPAGAVAEGSSSHGSSSETPREDGQVL